MIYLDNAATTFPKPNEVYKEVINCMENYAANPGRSSHNLAIKAQSKIMDTREAIKEIFNIPDPFQIIFTSNATESLNIGIKGILKNGDHVISTVIEHNSVLRPLNSLVKKGVQVTLLKVDKNGHINIKDLKQEIRKNTKLVIINHASNVIGTVQSISTIGKIAKEAGILFMVDASQSAGTINIDVEESNIDVLAFPGHKGLFGPQGTGGLFIRDGVFVEAFKEGGTGSNSSDVKQPDFMPDKFESGTLNTPGIAGLCEGIKFIKKVGMKEIYKHELLLTEYLLIELKKLDYVKVYGPTSLKDRCAVVSINIDGVDSSIVGYKLNEKNIAVRTGYHCAPLIHKVIGTSNKGTVRISPGYFNTFKDIETIIKSIRGIYKQ
ncbi:aminotransferase class V-fold PLP-dependent enzyme [Clostridium sp. P21]|uniref:cysteine desulfurase n=1 Tax=Clostridium muellerianum TaxID=2716538 RepID=A0A7Y0HKN5_9CLOT|nr:aminotransferase class V-fold PLP-dependent enzyme [Clostridium muellerianum]NMM61109.1 aminotransferase class V-fold PLP-dependent enzyme [Clostridium muellerianum]